MYPSIRRIAVSTAFLMLGLTIIGSGQSYQGRATAVRAAVQLPGQPLVTTAFSDTGNMPDSGGGTSLSGLTMNLPGSLASVSSSNASTSGASSTSQSSAGINNLSANILGNAITASVIAANAQAQCPGGSLFGSTVITGLSLNGASIAVTGDPNQTVPLFAGGHQVGSIVLNEQISSAGLITVNALHIRATDPLDATVTDLVVASTQAGISCMGPPPFNRFSGNGTGIWLAQNNLVLGSLATIISDTGALPGDGGNLSSSTTGAGVAGLLSTGVVASSSSGGASGGNPDSTQSDSTVNNLNITIGGPLPVSIAATVLQSNTQCQCTLSAPSCTGDSTVADLVVTTPLGNLPIVVTGQPNQSVTLPLNLGRLIINEQATWTAPSRARKSVTALHVLLTVPGVDATDVRIANADSGIDCAIAPSSAGVTVSGIVVDGRGLGVPRAVVSLADASGNVYVAATNGFGRFVLGDVPAGTVYVATVSHKGHMFTPQIISIGSAVEDLTFTAAAPGSVPSGANEKTPH